MHVGRIAPWKTLDVYVSVLSDIDIDIYMKYKGQLWPAYLERVSQSQQVRLLVQSLRRIRIKSRTVPYSTSIASAFHLVHDSIEICLFVLMIFFTALLYRWSEQWSPPKFTPGPWETRIDQPASNRSHHHRHHSRQVSTYIIDEAFTAPQ